MQNKTMAALGVAAFTLILSARGVAGDDAVRGDAARGRSVSATCQSCHGADGNKTMAPTIPKLAHQIEPYIDEQLHDFKSGERKNAIMSSMAAGLSDADIRDVAAYFASQAVTPDQGADAASVEAGGKIFTGGVADTSVPACSTCHGPQGAGVAPTYPRLASQHAAYLALQLHNFKSDDRHNDPDGVMRDIAAKLTEPQIRAVTAYLSSQP